MRHGRSGAAGALPHALGRHRCGLAAIPRLHRLTVRPHQERPTADAAGLRLDEPEHHLCRHCSIECRPAGTQHPRARIGRERMTGHDSLALEMPARLRD